MIPKFHILLIFILIYPCHADRANILFYMHISSYSHRVILYPLADALAKRGHQITFISPYHPKHPDVNPNITEIVPRKVAQSVEVFFNSHFDINFRVEDSMPRDGFYSNAVKICEKFLTSPELREYLEKTRSLDLIIMDNYMTECGMGIAHKYKAKHIFLHTLTMMPTEHDLYGIIPESSFIPELDIKPKRVPMSFYEGVQNALSSINWPYVNNERYNYLKDIDGLIRKHMKSNDTVPMPFVEDLVRNMSLVLYTGDVVTDFPRSLPPMIVNVAGLHCKKGKGPEELPNEIREFLDKDMESFDGFVYISFGSLAVSSNLPDGLKQVFFQSIKAYPKLKFLWKWNGEFPKNLPKNLFLAEWFPQMDILAHPKIKAFITQGGRPSTLESLYNGVPMIAFPVLGDQDLNSRRVNYMGGNAVLELGTVTGDVLSDAIKKVVYDESMKERVTELQSILLDRPMSPLETAVWWTECTLRQKDTFYLRSVGFHHAWFQRRMIHVYAFILVPFVLFLILIVSILVVWRPFHLNWFRNAWILTLIILPRFV